MMTVDASARMPDGLASLHITDEDWATFPPAAQRVIGTLWEELQRLREQVGHTSRNSSRPPSTDPPSAPPRKTKPPTGRAPGGQPGHAGHTHPLVPVDQVDALIPVRPAVCGQCGHMFPPDAQDPQPRRHQVADLPRVVATVTEYQLHTLTCPQCGEQTTAPLPVGVPTGMLGARPLALIATCTGQYHLSKRATATLLADCFGLPLGDATICAAEQTVSAALEAPVAAVAAAVRDADRKWMDETGWRQQRDPDPGDAPPAGKLPKAWLWIVVTPEATLVRIRRSRGSRVVTELLGATPTGIIHTDRWNGYHGLPPPQRQLCWAHLTREFTKLSERSGEAARIGAELLEHTHQLFTLWHRYQDGALTWPAVQEALAPLQTAVGDLLRDGVAHADKQTARTCRDLLKLEAALWTLGRVPGVEPTNNRAERGIRQGVLFRHVSFGTHSGAGSRFVERVMTAVATCKQQHRNVLDYLTAVVDAAVQGHPAPSLLPTASTA